MTNKSILMDLAARWGGWPQGEVGDELGKLIFEAQIGWPNDEMTLMEEGVEGGWGCRANLINSVIRITG